jgi:hypothetical protein
LNEQNTVPKRKTNKCRTRRRQSEKTKQKYEEAYITTYLNKTKNKNGVEGLFRTKNGQKPPPMVEE